MRFPHTARTQKDEIILLLKPSKLLEVMKTLIDNGTPIKTIAERWNVSRTTIYRYLNKLEEMNTEQV